MRLLHRSSRCSRVNCTILTAQLSERLIIPGSEVSFKSNCRLCKSSHELLSMKRLCSRFLIYRSIMFYALDPSAIVNWSDSKQLAVRKISIEHGTEDRSRRRTKCTKRLQVAGDIRSDSMSHKSFIIFHVVSLIVQIMKCLMGSRTCVRQDASTKFSSLHSRVSSGVMELRSAQLQTMVETCGERREEEKISENLSKRKIFFHWNQADWAILTSSNCERWTEHLARRERFLNPVSMTFRNVTTIDKSLDF